MLDRQILHHGSQASNPIFRRCPFCTTRVCVRAYVCAGARALDMLVTQITHTTLHGPISQPADSKHNYYRRTALDTILIPSHPSLNPASSMLTSIFKSPTQSPFFTAWSSSSSFNLHLLSPSSELPVQPISLIHLPQKTQRPVPVWKLLDIQ